MGEEVASSVGAVGVRTFTKALLTDLQALERMLEDGAIESGVRRFGLEQRVIHLGGKLFGSHDWIGRIISGHHLMARRWQRW